MPPKQEFNSEALHEMAVKEQEKQGKYKSRLFCCASTACLASGSTPVLETIKETIKVNKLRQEVQLVPTGCMGLCSHGPMVRVQAKNQSTDVLYQEVTAELAQQILDAHVLDEKQENKTDDSSDFKNFLPF